MEADRVELYDLAAREPDKVKELAAAWDAWAKRVGVRPWDEIGGKKQKK
jgi:arylsulfatase